MSSMQPPRCLMDEMFLPAMLRVSPTYGRPAREEDMKYRAYVGSILAPRIQYTTGGGSAANGSN